MAGFIQNILWNSVEGFVEAGKRSAGEFAGDALIKAGDTIENSGRGIGTKIERSASAYGEKISGQKPKTSAKALPSTASRPVAKRSNSLPSTTPKASQMRGRTIAAPTSKTPVGAKKYPGPGPMKQITGNAAPKMITNGSTPAKGVVGGGQKAIAGAPKGASRTAQKALTAGPKAVSGAAKSLPKPYNNSKPITSNLSPASTPMNNNVSKPSPYPEAKKTAVKPGKPKPFVPMNTVSDKKTPVKPTPPKSTNFSAYPGPKVEGGKVSHIPGFGGGSTAGSVVGTGSKASSKPLGGAAGPIGGATGGTKGAASKAGSEAGGAMKMGDVKVDRGFF